MKKYLEVVKSSTEEVVKSIDVTDSSDRYIEKMEIGLNINLNHDQYYTRVTEIKETNEN